MYIVHCTTINVLSSLEPASTRRAGYEYPEPKNKLLLPGR